MLQMKNLLAASCVLLTVLCVPSSARAQATEPFLGQLAWVPYNFAPRGWAFCDGQILSIAQNTALFALIGTTYGGNGQTTFALPDMRGRVPLHVGGSTGPGLSPYSLGQQGGQETVTLSQNQMPAHSHTALASNTEASAVTPEGTVWAKKERVTMYAPGAPNVAMGAGAIAPAGGSQPHENMPPYLGVNCIIAMQGIFPSRN